MKYLTTIILICSLLFNTSCFTPALYEATDPNEYVQIKYSEISEQEIKDKGVDYYKDDNTSSYYIEKSSFAKFSNYTVRALGTPVTVALDVTLGLVIVIAFSAAEDKIEKEKEKSKRDPY